MVVVCTAWFSITSTSHAYTAVTTRNVQRLPVPVSLRLPYRTDMQPARMSSLFSATASNDDGDSSIPEKFSATVSNDDGDSSIPEKTESEKKTGIAKYIAMLKPKSDPEMSTKDLLRKMGLSVFLSYGWVSNMSYCVSVSIAWFAFTTKTGLSPLAKGQWKPFLAVYAGFYVFNNIVRPLRIAAAVGVSKYFDQIITTLQNKMKLSRAVAIGLTVFIINICGTFALMALGITAASSLSRVPVFPPKV